MKKLILILLISIFAFMGIHNKAYTQQLSQDPLYQLVFQDNFDSLGLNSNKWNTRWPWGYNMFNANKIKSCIGSGFPGPDTVDCAFNFSPPNDGNNRVFDTTGSGFQRMIFRREDFNAPIIAYGHPCPSAICTAHSAGCYPSSSGTECAYDSIVPFKFSGAMLKSKRIFKYAYIEMRYRLSNIAGPNPNNAYGPNLWMWRGDAPNALYSEIDIFEQRGYDWHMDLNFHYRKLNPSGYAGSNPSDTVFWHGKTYGAPTTYVPYTNQLDAAFSLPYNNGNWHTVGCEWTPEYIDTYYDSNDTIRRFSSAKLPVDGLAAMPIIIDNYTPAAQYCIPYSAGNTTMPFNYDIDYVRVYQVNQVANCANTSGNFLNTSSVTYVSKLYRDLTIGGTGGSAVFNSGTHHLAGQNYVLLQEGFEVSGNATVIISTLKCQTGQAKDDDNDNYSGLPSQTIINDLTTAKKHYE